MNKINSLLLNLVFLTCLLALGGCAPPYKKVQQEFIEYNEEPLGQGIKPDINLNGVAIKVAVTDFSLPNEQASPDYQAARLANLTQYAAEVVNDAITKAGGALVNKEDANKIKAYIQDAEKRGNTSETSNTKNTKNTGDCSKLGKRTKNRKRKQCIPEEKQVYTGLSDVNYAMLGEISSVSYGASTTTTQSFIKGQGPITLCNYSASISGTLAVYKIPKTVRESSIRFQADNTESTEGACQQGSLNPQVIRITMEKAINAVKAEFQNLLAVDAYVIGKRVHRETKNSIFQISAGKNLNLQPGVKIRLMHIEKHFDPVTEKQVDQETMVGQGTISDKVEPDRSWILVEQADDKGISMWDIGRPFHENCKYLSLCKWMGQ